MYRKNVIVYDENEYFIHISYFIDMLMHQVSIANIVTAIFLCYITTNEFLCLRNTKFITEDLLSFIRLFQQQYPEVQICVIHGISIPYGKHFLTIHCHRNLPSL